jgi:hypothetical protein
LGSLPSGSPLEVIASLLILDRFKATCRKSTFVAVSCDRVAGYELFLVKLVFAFPAEADAFVAVALEAESGEAE